MKLNHRKQPLLKGKAYPNCRAGLVSKKILILSFALLLPALSGPGASLAGESCIQCHLHQSIMEDAASSGKNVDTLAAFHVRAFEGGDPLTGCRKCHEDGQSEGKLPGAHVCIRCHTRGKTAQGNPEMVFHAERNHWPMEKVSCIRCHNGHLKGNPDIKFLTPDVVATCGICHEKSFGGMSSRRNEE